MPNPRICNEKINVEEHLNADTLRDKQKPECTVELRWTMEASYPSVATEIEPTHIGRLLRRLPLRWLRQGEVWCRTLMKRCSIDALRVIAWSRF
jgi:hypothetical protein